VLLVLEQQRQCRRCHQQWHHLLLLLPPRLLLPCLQLQRLPWLHLLQPPLQP
jgi:hypothetical protein